MDQITAFIPTMPSRLACLPLAIESLLPQVDKLYVLCDDPVSIHDKVPNRDPKLFFACAFNRGSAARFIQAKTTTGYLFFCDDDLAYPSDYVKKLVDGIEKYRRKCVVGWHGKTLNVPLSSLFGCGAGRIRRNYPCLGTVYEDAEVHIIGTGAMAYHSLTLQIDARDFKNNNLDDAEFSILCQNRGIPLVVLPHRQYDLTYLNPTGTTIWGETVNNPNPLLKLINSHEWKLHGIVG